MKRCGFLSRIANQPWAAFLAEIHSTWYVTVRDISQHVICHIFTTWYVWVRTYSKSFKVSSSWYTTFSRISSFNSSFCVLSIISGLSNFITVLKYEYKSAYKINESKITWATSKGTSINTLVSEKTKQHKYYTANEEIYAMLCTIWYHLHNLQNVEKKRKKRKKHGGVLLKVECFHVF